METNQRRFKWHPVPIGRGWHLCILTLLLQFGIQGNIRAAMSFGSYSYISQQPTIANPWIEINLCFYDATKNSNSFFTHGSGFNGYKGPALFVDDDYVCSPDWELAWPGSDNTGNNDGLDDERGNNSWWGNTYNQTVGNKNYQVRFYDPRKEGNRYYVTVVIYCRQLELNRRHTITIQGQWKINNQSLTSTYYEWTTNAIEGYVTPTAVMTDYNHLTLKGSLNYSYGPTVVGTATPFYMDYYPQNRLTESKQYNQGTSSYTYEGMAFDRTDYYDSQLKRIEYIFKRTVSDRGDFYLYQWFNVWVPGFIKAEDMSYEADIWNKQMSITWKADESGNRCKEGTWRIYRSVAGSDDWTLLASDLPYTQRRFTDSDDALGYDMQYDYKIIFIPKGAPATLEPEELTETITASLTRTFSFSDLTVSEDKEDKIVFAWTHTALENASSHPYTLVVERSTDDPTLPEAEKTWTEVYRYTINSKTTTTGSYDDTRDLVAFQDYSYRLKATVFDKDYISTAVTGHLAGMSYVTDFTATRGTYSNMVKLRWTAKQVGSSLTYYDVQRRPLGSTNDDDWITLTTVSGTASSYSYDDVTALPGSYSQYRLITWLMYQDQRRGNSTTLTDGFSVATGVISGRVTYGTGTAVEGARVTLVQNNADGEPASALRSLLFSGTKAGMSYNTKAKTMRQLFGNDFSVQLYVNPSLIEMNTDGVTYSLFDANGLFDITLTYDAATEQYLLGAGTGATRRITDLAIPSGQWHHLTCVYSKATGSATFYVVEADTLQQTMAFNSEALDFGSGDDQDDAKVGLAYLSDTGQPTFKGYVDEFRIFTKALTEKEILRNYNHPLSGSETALALYWPMDEGIDNQRIAYDFSKTNNVGNGRHGTAEQPATSSPKVPSDDQLSLMGYTNEQGTYEVRGVPFSGEGTSYTITPTMGEHQFSPAYQTRFVNMSMLNHSGVDFEDVSSFSVSGVVYYEHTTIPVAEASLYVDGVMASKDGEPIMTDSKGKFTISVPIGDHFVQVKKQGHTFLHNGRYPADDHDTGLRHTFDQDITGLTFTDQTLVTVTGRVAGGDIEYEKPLGLGAGKANIGKARLRLELSNNNGYLNVADPEEGSTVVSYNMSDTQRDFQTASGKAYVPGGENYITIETDSLTGEWTALLPPLRYDVTSVVIPHNNGITKDNFSMPVIDATNPNLTYTDSLETDDGVRTFEYHASANMEYKSASTIDVTEHDDGSFGMEKYTVKDLNGTKHDISLYTIGSGGAVNYTYGYPVYQELSTYRYTLYAYERYTNYDGAKPVIDEVPLAGKTVTIKNQFASTTAVSQEDGSLGPVANDQLELNDKGKAVYQFTVGFPNIQEPYTRGLSISYDNDGTEMPWSGNGTFQAIVLGGLPTGNNFVTQGPDEVFMVLRDPPGSHSQTVWSKGTSISSNDSFTNEFHSNYEMGTTVYAGVKDYSGVGGVFIVINEVEAVANLNVGVQYNAQRTDVDSHTTTVTTTRDISTSDAIDFVGAPGDVFIGSAKNIIFGANRAVDIKWNDLTGQAELKQEDAMSKGEEFTTGFAYTQNYIKETLIPNFKKLRNDLLKPGTGSVSRPAKGEEPLYVTTLDPNDPRYGTSNNDEETWGDAAVSFSTLSDGVYAGPSYTMLLPIDYEKDKDGVQDMVKFYNTQISKWEKELRKNEQAKVTAIQNRDKWLKDNHSFDAGAAITVSVTNDQQDTYTDTDVDEVNAVLGGETGHMFSGIGFELRISETIGHTFVDEHIDDTLHTCTTAYTLLEDGDDDYLSVDVYNAPDGFGPIFYTRAGATSCPYEDEVVTDYYQKGTVIMQKTVQIEKPEIEAQNQTITGIPAGGTGTFKVNIRNNSDTDEDLWFDILVPPYSNPDGLSVTMDDTSLNYGTSVLVKAGKTMEKTISVSQTNPDVLNYPNVKLRIASQCQKDNTSTYAEIADSTEFSVFFQPTCSDIQLSSTHTLVNTDTESPVTLSMSGYNYPMASLRGIRLQYKGEHDADFRTLQEYTKDSIRAKSDPNLLILPPLQGTNKLAYIIDLRTDDFTDKTYVFRAITVCDQGGVEVNNESEEVTIVRDMTRPMLIATPSPANGILGSGDDLIITFNEDIQGGILTEPNNFDVAGVLNESEVAHDVALSLNGENSAKTDATIDLSGKSFAISLWLNCQTDGQLLMHGTADNNFSAAIVGGKLAVSVAGETTTSTVALPKDKWIYLNVSYEAAAADGSTSAILNADYAKDSETVKLIRDAATASYEGNGPLSLGGDGLTAKVQELAVWNSNRSMAEAQTDMHTTKSQYTSGLIGYWQLNEGHGAMAADQARSRHLTLPSGNAWWVNGANYALTLDGTKAAAVNIGTMNTTTEEDYLVEAWFKADEEQAGTATILSTMKTDLRLNAQGQMELLCGNTADPANDQALMVSSSDLRDGQWHHVAINVLKSTNGSGIVYIDGQQSKQIAASAMPALYGDKLFLGGRRVEAVGAEYTMTQLFKGAIDEVRIWKSRRTADVIRDNMYNRVAADAPGLAAYYPLEKNRLDDFNQIVAEGTLQGQSEGLKDELAFYDANNGSLTAQASLLTSANTAALKQAPRQENVQFNFVASERQIKVTLTEDPYKIENCHIYITTKNVKDLNGNSAQPVTWSVYVQQNNLKWEQSDVAVTKSGSESASFSIAIKNDGSQNEPWSLSGMPEWLSVSTEGGTLAPLSQGNLTFTVAESLPIGTYETTVYLTGSQNIATPLNITVTSEGNAPDWTAVPGENTMTIIGQLIIDGIISSDTKDMVAAFRGTECVGVAHPLYFSRYDAYMVMLNIYGDEETDLTYKVYDASTGQTYPSVSASNESAYTFISDKALGSFNDPVLFNPLNEIEQDLSMDHAAWKWFSLFVQPKVNEVSVVFKDALDAITTLTNGTQSVMAWSGNLEIFEYDRMYKLKATKPYTETVVGAPTNPLEVSITLKNGWTWIGYPCQATNSLGAAFASAEPQEGDMVKDHNSFATFTEGEWIGTLTAMQPGRGYMYSNTTAEKSFHYPKPATSGRMNAPRRTESPATLMENIYRDNMTLIAVVMDGSQQVDEAQVSVYAGTELRGLSDTAIRDGRHFITIGGEQGQTGVLTFVVNTPEGEYMLTETMPFEADAHHGTMAQPYELQLRGATSIDWAEAAKDVRSIRLYDTHGHLVRSTDHPSRLYNKSDVRNLPYGVYYQQVTLTDGHVLVQKLIR